MKREQIISAALQLFAKNGIDGTSTRSIAENAAVSEGLIFRHFKSKAGLIEAILALGTVKIHPIIDPIQREQTPKQRLKRCILALANVPREDYPYWRVVFLLNLRSDPDHEKLTQELKLRIQRELKALGYARAEIEAQLLTCSLEGLFFKALFDPEFSLLPYLNLIVKKYQLTP